MELNNLTNLLDETIEFLYINNKTEEDIDFVLTQRGSCSWQQFKEIASQIYYYNGYGCNNISLHIEIVGKDWRLERFEYDGAECWLFKAAPKKLESIDLNIKDLICNDCKDEIVIRRL